MKKATILTVSAAVVLFTRICADGGPAITSFDRQGRMLWSDPQSALTHYRLETAPTPAGPWMDQGMIIPCGDPLYLASMPMTETYGCSRVIGSWGVPAWNLEVVGRTGGDYFEIEVQGQYAYVLEAGGLTILDVSDPANLRAVGMAAFGGLRRDGGYTGDLVVRGDYVYVTAGYSESHQMGLRIFDIRTPSHPFQTGYFLLSGGDVLGVVLSGNYAYVGQRNFGIHVVDITDPTHPVEVGSLQDGSISYSTRLFVVGHYLYAGSKIIDISFPTLPLEVGSLPVSGSMAMEGNLLYVAAGSLEILDATNPANPTMVGRYGMQYAGSVAVHNNRAYVVEFGTMRVFDVSNPSNPSEVAIYDERGYGPRDVAVQGDFAYLAGEQGLRIIDVAAPYNGPVEVAYFGTESTGVAIGDGLAYVTESEFGLRILDLSLLGSQSALVEVGSYELTGSRFREVAVRGNYAYVLDGPAGLRIIDVGATSDPAEVGFCPISDWPYAITLSGNYAYVAADEAGLRIIDVSNASAPVDVGSYNTRASDVALGGNYAYVTGEQGGLLVLDVSNPANPWQVALIPGQDCRAERWAQVAIDGNYVYFTCYNTLQILDVSTPSNPIEVGRCSYTSLSTPQRITSVVVIEGRAYLTSFAEGFPELHIVDVSNPAVPVEVSSYPILGGFHDLAVSGDLAYVAIDNEGGLRVIDIINPTNSAAQIGAHVVPSGERYHDSDEYERYGIYGGYAYLGNDLGLKIVDLQDPTLPVVNTYPLTEEYPAVGSLRISGDYAYATIGGRYHSSASGRGELRILDLTTPTIPAEVGSHVIVSENWRDLYPSRIGAVSGDYAYLKTGSTREELRILDVSNPANPTEVGSYFTEGINQVVVQGDYAYLTTFQWGNTPMGWLRVIDVRNPASPRAVASVEFPYSPEVFIAVNGNHAYLSGGGEHGMRVFDISNPASPQQVGNLYPNKTTFWPLTTFGSYVAMSLDITPTESSYTRGLRLVDVSDPTAPTEVGFMNIGGDSLAMDANRMFVFDTRGGGSWILDLLGM